MLPRTLFILIVLAFAGVARAHFPFVVPDSGGATAKLIFSETLKPDDEVDVVIAGGSRLTIRTPDGEESPLKLVKGEHLYTLDTPGTGTRVIRGVTDAGVMQRGKGKPHHLVYHPKTIIGDAFDPKAAPVGDAPVELVPVGRPGAVQLELSVNGKPLADAEVVVLLPDATEERVKTGDDGRTRAFNQPGRYGAWARHWVDKPGELDGKPYEQQRHYATLVFGAGEPRAALWPVQTLAPLPHPVASFGAVACDGQLYFYGGHVAPMHDYSTAAVSNQFHRTKLASPGKWEPLPGGPGIQGMNLAAHGGKVYRVGGMQPRNAPGEPEDNLSIADAARFDPGKGAWEKLPPLPSPRSSHDLAFIDNKLYVVGGWNMQGKDIEAVWIDAVDVLDVSQPNLKWQSIKQPFTRRALIVTTLGDRLFVMGGMDANDDLHPAVNILNTRTGEWSKGPDLPGKPFNGFSPAACTVGGRAYVSVATGELLRLGADETSWERVARSTPRIVHRLVPDGDRILILGGASKGAMQNVVESVTLSDGR